MEPPVSILIPTWNNSNDLRECLNSILQHQTAENLFHIYVINNGHKDSCNWVQNKSVTLIQAGDNLGWEGGLKLGLKHSKSPYVLFLNDDTFVPFSSSEWLYKMLQHFRDEKVGAVGPSSNVVMGCQNIWANIPYVRVYPKYLIGFCMLLKRSILDEVGSVDDTLPGGDDLDLSIRLRDKGYKLVADRNVFIYHHGFRTGERIYGKPNQSGGWNSYEFKERTDFALIKKHGFRKWYETISGGYESPVPADEKWEDLEGKAIRKWVKGKVILDLGCGSNKTLPNAIGLDLVKKDDTVATLVGKPTSQADMEADVSKPLPFADDHVDTVIARHVLEHLIDTVTVLEQWITVLKPGGRLIIAVPDERRIHSIPMNMEHVHAFTPDSMCNLLEACGLKILKQIDPKNGVSFITVAEKV